MEYQRRKPSRDERVIRAENELNGYRARVAQIHRLKDRRQEIEINYTAIRCIDYSKLRVQGGAPFNDMVETAVQWADLEKKIDDLAYENEQELLMIEYKLQKLSEREQTVLFKYYIEARTLQQIAAAMNYSFDGIRKIKHHALLKYAEL